MTDLVQVSSQKFECKICHYSTSRSSQYTRHITTAKHIQMTSNDKQVPNSSKYICHCGNKYKYRQGLFSHRKKCDASCQNQSTVSLTPATDPIPAFDAALVIELLKQNQEFKALMLEQSKQLAEQHNQMAEQHNQMAEQQIHFLEAIKDGKIGNTNTNCNNNTTNNNKFNLNVFLNETCKDAITMEDFVKSVLITRDEFIHTGNVGFIDGISTVMMNRFRDMDMHTRPLHCTDLKRETVYIKNAYKWEKEDNNKTHLRKAVKGVANQNMKELWRWYNDNKPDVELIGTDECENYFRYYKAALGGCGKEEDIKFEDKIIKNVLKAVHIDKTTSLTI